MAKSIKELEHILTNLLGKKSYICSATPCTGKYRGTSDYSLVFDDGTSLFISKGRAQYRIKLLLYITQFSYYHQHKEQIEEWIRTVLRHDNRTAEWQKLPPIEFIGTRIDEDLFIVFDYYMCISKEQKLKLTYKETGFSYYCKGCGFKDYADKVKSFIYKY